MATELLLSTQAQNQQKVSCCFWDYSNGNVLQIYKNGGNVSDKGLEIIRTDYIVTAEKTKPLLHVWNLNNQEPIKNVRFILPEPANALALSPRSTYLAAGINCKLYVWELCSGKLLTVQQIHYQPITCLKFASCGGFLVIAGADGMVVTYNLSDLISTRNKLKTQSELGQIEPIYKRMDHSLPINDLQIGKFGFKSRFVTVSSDQTLRVYQLANGQLLLTLVFDRPLTSVVVDAPFHTLYVGNDLGLITKFDLTNPPQTLEHHLDDAHKNNYSFLGHKGKITSLDVNVYNNRLASASEDLNILIWDLNSRQVLRKIEIKSVPTNLKFVLTAEHMFAQNAKPETVLSNLERNVEADLRETTVSIIQDGDVCVRGESLRRKRLQEKDAVQDLQAQVLSLQRINADLFLELQKYK